MSTATITSLPKTDRRHPGVRAAATALAVLLLVTIGAGLAPPTVRAHAELVDADPAPNSVIPASPPSLALLFSEAIDPASIRLRVLDADERPVPGLGEPHLDASGQVLVAELPALAPGSYVVDYAIVSAVDGHPNASLYAFVVDPTGQEPPPAPAVPEGSPGETGAVAAAARWLATIAALMLIGTVVVWLVHARVLGVSHRVPVPWLFLGALGVAAFVGVSAHLVRAAAVVSEGTGLPLGSSGLPFDPAAPFGWTPYAIAMRLALLGALTAVAVAAVGWWSDRRRSRLGDGATLGDRGLGRIGLAVTGMAGMAIVAGLSLTGHASAQGGPLGAAVDAMHLIGIAAWLGALPAVILLARQIHAQAPGGQTRGEIRRRALGAHAQVAMIAAPLVILTGLANSPLVVANPREIVASEYGNLLLAKAGLVSIALALGATNFLIVRHRRGRGVAWAVALELAVAVIAVGVGTTMVSTEPATDRPATAADPRLGVAHLYGEDGHSRIHGIVDLPEPGVQAYAFAIADPSTGAGRQDVVHVTLTFLPPPESSLAPETVPALASSEPWVWSVRGAYTPAAGNWEVEVLVHLRDLGEDRVLLPLAVREVLRPMPLPPPVADTTLLGALAAPASALPAGAVAWTAPLALLAVAAALLAVERQRGRAEPSSARARRGGRVVRAVVVAAAVVIGTSLIARDAVAIANRPPATWLAAVNPLVGDPASVGAGERLYRANCSGCHGVDGDGNGPMAPTLPGRISDLADVVPYRDDGELAWVIGAGMAGTQMPAFGNTLLEGERWELVSYLRSRWPLSMSE